MHKFLAFSIALTSIAGCSTAPEYTKVPSKLETCTTTTSTSVKYGVRIGSTTRIACDDRVTYIDPKCVSRYDTVQLPTGRWSEEVILMCPDNKGGFYEVTYISTE